MVPVNLRATDEGKQLGNRVSSLFVHLPVCEPDPVRRYLVTAGETAELKSGAMARGGAELIALSGLAPPLLHSVLARSTAGARLFNLTITNVPGPTQPLYAFGAKLEDVMPLVPLAADHAVGIAVVSYNGKVFFGLSGDERALPDLDVLRGGIEDSIAELRSITRRGGRAGRGGAPRQAMSTATPRRLHEVQLGTASLERFRTVLDDEQWARLKRTAARARREFDGRVVWNVNSTARGGGVAELLGSLVPYSRGAGVDVRWVVIDGDPAFFRVTKRLHNMLHGMPGDGEGLSPADEATYRAAERAKRPRADRRGQPGDLVLLHDPQTAGLVAPLRRHGARVVWRCHVGVDVPNDLVRRAWSFLLPHVAGGGPARLLAGGIRLGGPRPRARRA